MREGLILSGPVEKLTPAATVARLWRWRDFIWTLTAREIKMRYVGSIGGAAWNIIQPLALIAVFTVIFSFLLKMSPFNGGRGYLIYLVAGLLPWNAFQDALQRSSNVYIEHSNLVRKLPFPLESLVAQTVASATLNLLISIGLLCLLLPVLGVEYSSTLLLLPFAVLFQVFITVGPALIVASLTPFWRDVSPITGLFLFLGFWITPIVYTPDLIPSRFMWVFKLNPFYHIVRLYRACCVGFGYPTTAELAGTACAGAVFLVLGWWIFSKLHRKIPENL